MQTTPTLSDREQRLVSALRSIVIETMDYPPTRPYNNESYLPPQLIQQAQDVLTECGMRCLTADELTITMAAELTTPEWQEFSPKDTSATIPPAPGQHWPEQGGTYIGIAPAEGTLPMRHLVVLDVEPDSRLTWRKAIDWALDQGNGARLPTQLEAMFAWTTARAAFKPGWHWTGTQSSRNFAFVQDFEYGGSYWGGKDDERRVRAVRGLDLQTLNPLTGDAHAEPVEKI